MAEKSSYRNVRKVRYTQVGNDMLNDRNLSLEAKGLLSIFLSNTEDWKIHMKEIITRSKNGRDKHYSVVKELVEHGYIGRVEVRAGGKFGEVTYVFSDNKQDVLEAMEELKDKGKNIDIKGKTPLPENPDTVGNSPLPEIPDTVLPDTVPSYTVDPDTNNTKGNNTKSNNTKDNKNNQSVSHKEEKKNDYMTAINELFAAKEVPIPILKTMSVNVDRLTDFNIHPYEIENFYNSFTEHQLNETDFATVLSKVLKSKEPISNFHSYMKTSASNWYKEYEQDGELV